MNRVNYIALWGILAVVENYLIFRFCRVIPFGSKQHVFSFLTLQCALGVKQATRRNAPLIEVRFGPHRSCMPVYVHIMIQWMKLYSTQ